MVTFNPHGNVTSDGTVISVGMAVRTNDWTVGTVVGESTSMCCSPEQPACVKAQTRVSGTWFSDHPAANALAYPHTACRHDHWFEVKDEDGATKTYNGERLLALA